MLYVVVEMKCLNVHCSLLGYNFYQFAVSAFAKIHASTVIHVFIIFSKIAILIT